MAATSIFFIVIIASNVRFASAPSARAADHYDFHDYLLHSSPRHFRAIGPLQARHIIGIGRAPRKNRFELSS
jgi:hypothetical protein